MKKLIYISAASFMVLMTYCKSSKSATTTSNSMDVNDKQLAVVESRWTGTPLEDIKQGQTIFTTKCTECHANQVITDLSEKKWLHEIDDMSPKAKLSADEKLKLTKYILSYREANTAKPN